MTRYDNGANFERRLKLHLQENGWLPFRIAGSRGLVDIVAIAPGPTVALVQCKTNGKLPQADADALRNIALAFDCIPILGARNEKRSIIYSELFADRRADWYPE